MHLAIVLAVSLCYAVASVQAENVTTSICEAFALQPKSASRLPLVYDLFIVNQELDMIEIRLRELEAVVDVFVVLESRMTFRGSKRDISFPRVLHRLPGAVIAKVRYSVLDALEGDDAWSREHYQRDALFTVALQSPGVSAHAGDILLVSDVDEIPKPAFIRAMKLCDGFRYPLSLHAQLRYYAFDTLVGQSWHAPRAVLFSQPLQLTASEVRRLSVNDVTVYLNTSWHCSYCFDTIAAFQRKLESFSHAEYDTTAIKDPHNIAQMVREGKDVLLRNMPKFVKETGSIDMPQYIRNHPSRFSYLATRDTLDSGFKDL
eukprot:GHRR01004241.1.p1 GENE.GHRR01004241.1~~GHRR01004241.1.p1  ORF type:complete len:317 (+),score=5.20 GHRR01004241.1:63-1013(+)